MNLVFPLRLAAGETLDAECVRAEVMAGESRLPPTQVQLQLQLERDNEGEGARAVQLHSLVPINEPVVMVNLAVGCPVRFTRQYTAFVDPPGSAPALPAPETLSPSRAYSPALRAALATSEAKPSALLATPPAASASASRPAELPQVAAVTRPAASAPNAGGAASSAPGVSVAQAEHAPRPRAKPRGRRHSVAAAPAPVPVKAAPRLQLEAPEVLTAAQPTSAPALAPVLIPDPESQARLSRLEESLGKLQAENKATRAQLGQLRGQLEQAEAARWNNPLVYGLAALSLLLAGALALLGLRLRRQGLRAGASAWWDEEAVSSATAAVPMPDRKAEARPVALPEAVATPPLSAALSESPALAQRPEEFTLPLPGLDPPDAPPTLPAPVSVHEHAWVEPAPEPEAEPISFQLIEPEGLAPSPAATTQGARGHVSAEELIDLEQQVDFFVVLGQDEAALELLNSQLSGAGQNVPLPYLKLLEQLQRRGDEAGFAALAERYARRFDLPAPDWATPVAGGVGLAAFGPVLAQLQRHWRDPGASMDLLQGLLTGAPGAESGLDLAAYLDLMLLYCVARDLSEHEVRGEDIDLFLPLESPRSGAGRARAAQSAGMLATMVWHAPAGAREAAASPLVEVDIPLDDMSGEPEPGAA